MCIRDSFSTNNELKSIDMDVRLVTTLLTFESGPVEMFTDMNSFGPRQNSLEVNNFNNIVYIDLNKSIQLPYYEKKN